jgi:predicted nucleic acid-binding protein
MSGKAFLDTNIFVYANDQNEPRKRAIALDLIRHATDNASGIVSTQVVQEFFNVVLVKSRQKMPHADAQRFLMTAFRPLLAVHSSIALISEAIRIQERYLLSWYDSLIVAAAQQAGCNLLYTEDLQHGQKFGALTVLNPFLK